MVLVRLEVNEMEKEKWESSIAEVSIVPVGIYNYPMYILGRLRAWWERGKGYQTVLMVLASDSTKIAFQGCEVRVYRLILIG